MPKVSKRTPPAGDAWDDANRKDPGHDLNQPHQSNKRKNTKRWCKGHVGREHDYRMTKHLTSSWFSYDILACTQCGKQTWRKPVV